LVQNFQFRQSVGGTALAVRHGGKALMAKHWWKSIGGKALVD
jgi:hypothetical protein